MVYRNKFGAARYLTINTVRINPFGFGPFLAVFALLILAGCQPSATSAEYNAKAANPERYNVALNKLTQVVIHDIFSPPVASRIYAYDNLAGYEALVPFDARYESLAGKTKRFTPGPNKASSWPLNKSLTYPTPPTHPRTSTHGSHLRLWLSGTGGVS